MKRAGTLLARSRRALDPQQAPACTAILCLASWPPHTCASERARALRYRRRPCSISSKCALPAASSSSFSAAVRNANAKTAVRTK